MKKKPFRFDGGDFIATITEPSKWNLDQEPRIAVITIAGHGHENHKRAKRTCYLLNKWFKRKTFAELEKELLK